METLPITSTTNSCLESGGCHILIVNRSGNGKGMQGHQKNALKAAYFLPLLKKSVLKFPIWE